MYRVVGVQVMMVYTDRVGVQIMVGGWVYI